LLAATRTGRAGLACTLSTLSNYGGTGADVSQSKGDKPSQRCAYSARCDKMYGSVRVPVAGDAQISI
jgi:hypothetical protein